jgi:hypothetical protein
MLSAFESLMTMGETTEFLDIVKRTPTPKEIMDVLHYEASISVIKKDNQTDSEHLEDVNNYCLKVRPAMEQNGVVYDVKSKNISIFVYQYYALIAVPDGNPMHNHFCLSNISYLISNEDVIVGDTCIISFCLRGCKK